MAENRQIKLITDLVKHASWLDDKIDDVIEPYKDYTETIQDIVMPLKILMPAISLAKGIKFKRFLRKFAEKVNEGTVGEEFLGRLNSYLQREANLEHIADIISSSVETKSSICSAILGYYAGLTLNDSSIICYKDMVILNALKIMNNSDINNFLLVFERFNETNRSVNSQRVHDLKEEFEGFGVSVFELENTIEKLKSIQVIGYDVGGLGGVGFAWGSFKFNENTQYLYDVIKKSGVMETIDAT